MYFNDIVRRSGRNLRQAKARTILTALAIAVGGFTLTMTLAAGNGVRSYTDKLISSNFDPAELFVGRDKEISNTGTPSEKPQEFDESVTSLMAGGPNNSLQVKRVTKADTAELRATPYIESVRESYQINIRYVTREGQKKYTGTAEPYNPAQKPEIKSGSLPAGGDIEKGSVLLPETYIEPLGFGSSADALGKEIQLTIEQPFSAVSLQTLLGQLQAGAPIDENTAKPAAYTATLKIAAVTKRPATSFTFGVDPLRVSALDAKALYDYTAQGTPDYEKYLFVFARIKDGKNPAAIADAKKDLESKGYFVMSSKDVQKALTQIVNILQITVGVFGLITLIASVFGIVNTQYISVLERTREIGLMKALGMRKREVARLFMLEATWIGFIGGVFGALLGIIVGVALNPWITTKLDLGAGNHLLIFKVWQISILIAVLMLVATIAGLLPARKAAKLDPIEALRTE